MQTCRLWLETSHHAAFRLGGWAYVRADGAQVSGQAGGDRGVDLERIALIGLLAALKDLPAGATAELRSASAAVRAIPGRLAAAAAGEDPPSDNLDLWAQAAAALKSRAVTMVPASPQPKTPSAFAAAWAEQGRERAKPKGAFAAAIPKPNLASAGVPPV